jgi:rubrerythrin
MSSKELTEAKKIYKSMMDETIGKLDEVSDALSMARTTLENKKTSLRDAIDDQQKELSEIIEMIDKIQQIENEVNNIDTDCE